MDDKANYFWERAGMPLRHMKATGLQLSNAWAASAERLAAKLGKGFLVALLGPRGTGKTQMATCLIRQACRRHRESRYVRAAELFRQLRESFNSNNDCPSEAVLFERYTTCALLVIDEAHERGNTAFENRTLTNIIDHRYGNLLDTLLISNEAPKEFGEAIGDSVKSRMQETGSVIMCDWESFRDPQGKE